MTSLSELQAPRTQRDDEGSTDAEPEPTVGYRTSQGMMVRGTAELALPSSLLTPYRGKVQLVFTSPPFALNNKKRYGNLQGAAYEEWLASMAPLLREMLKPDGSIVIELGNAWERGRPVMSTLRIWRLHQEEKSLLY